MDRSRAKDNGNVVLITDCSKKIACYEELIALGLDPWINLINQ